ncbi:MAG TPA: hypothetical protein VF057_00185 [Thermoanaerobaculia bacterium]
MFRFPVVVGVVAMLSAGCVVDRGRPGAAERASAVEPVETAKDTYAIGATVTPQGAIPREALTEQFPRGGEVYLSINVTGASTDQEITVQWLRPDGKVIREDAMDAPEGTSFVAFSSGPTDQWQSGEHKAVVLINGRRVSERQFQLI